MNVTDYRALSFDVYGTLIDWEAGIGSVLTAWAGTQGLALSEEELLVTYAANEAAVAAAIATVAELKDPTESPLYAPFKKLPTTIPAAEQARLQAQARPAASGPDRIHAGSAPAGCTAGAKGDRRC